MTHFTVVYDANVLYPFNMRDVLVQVAQPELDLVRARWTDEILDEAFWNLLKDRPSLRPEQLERTRRLMCEFVPDCLVEGYRPLIEGLRLPDQDDRHVLAAAIQAGAEVIVTRNLADFPADYLQQFDIEAHPPDEFILNLMSISERAARRVLSALSAIAGRRRNPPRSLQDLLAISERNGFPRSMTRLREMFFADEPAEPPGDSAE